MTRSRFLAAMMLLAAWPSVSDAAIVHDLFFRVGGADEIDSTIIVVPGTTLIGVDVVLRETITAPDNPIFGASPLSSAGADINAVGSGSAVNAMANAALFLASPLADADTIAAGSFGTGVDSVMVSAGVFEGVIGTVDLIGPTAQSQQVTFTLADVQPAPANSNFRTVATDFDDTGINFRSLTLQTTAVPEPSSIAILALAGVGGWIIRRRRKRISLSA